jgi:hypothetical protein
MKPTRAESASEVYGEAHFEVQDAASCAKL